MINIVSFFTSIYAGFAVFSIIGYMADQYNMEVDKIIDSGERGTRSVCPHHTRSQFTVQA